MSSNLSKNGIACIETKRVHFESIYRGIESDSETFMMVFWLGF
jgi:hypothetical protein